MPKLLVRGERVSAIAAMSINGIVDLKIVRGLRGSVNGDVYVDFIEKQLLPHLMTNSVSNNG